MKRGLERKKGPSRFVQLQIIVVVICGLSLVSYFIFDYRQSYLLALLRGGKGSGRQYLEQDVDDDVNGANVASKVLPLSLLVIPGGGSGKKDGIIEKKGSDKNDNTYYPEWTYRRTEEAFAFHQNIIRSNVVIGDLRGHQNLQDGTNTSLLENGALSPYFLALSAGSLNSPNLLHSAVSKTKDQIIFECMHTIHHLKSLGISQSKIMGDFMSWDTIGNAWVLRMTVKGLVDEAIGMLPDDAGKQVRQVMDENRDLRGVTGVKEVQKKMTALLKGYTKDRHLFSKRKLNLKKNRDKENGKDTKSSKKEEEEEEEEVEIQWDPIEGKLLLVEVFISDFHLNRVKEAFTWLLGLQPSLLPYVRLRMHSVSSEGIEYLNAATFKDRMLHETKGVQQVQANAKQIETEEQFVKWLMGGGHKGIQNYLMDAYTKSSGVGW